MSLLTQFRLPFQQKPKPVIMGPLETFEQMELLSNNQFLYVGDFDMELFDSYEYYNKLYPCKNQLQHVFVQVGTFYIISIYSKTGTCFNDPPEDMPVVSLRKLCTFREVRRCYKKTLDCNVAEWVAFNHELYKPGGAEMLKLVDKYTK
jgi:hypothetical protein